MSNIIINKIRSNPTLSRILFIQLVENNSLRNVSKTCKLSSNSEENSDEIKSGNYDIVINGGGIVGFSLLSALKSSPFLRQKKIVLIEQQLEPKNEMKQMGADVLSNRVSSITNSSKQFFQRIGIWDQLKEFAKPIKQMYVWSHVYRNGINFRSNNFDDYENIDTCDDSVCYVIENNRILAALQAKVNQSDDDVCYGTVVTDIKVDQNLLKIDTKCIKNEFFNSFKTSLLIGCDGFNSVVRQKSNLTNFEHDMEQMGIVGTVSISCCEGNESNNIAFQRFSPLDNSILALLPLTQDHCSFVLSVSKHLAKVLMQKNDEEFVDHLNETIFSENANSLTSITTKLDDLMTSLLPQKIFSQTIPEFSGPHILSVIPDSRAAFPLKFSTTVPFMVGKPANNEQRFNKIVIIGDAAHRVHPLAGQGLNLGLGDADALSQCLHKQLYRGESLFGDNESDSKQLEKSLFEFEQKRQIKLIPMMSAIHSMQQIFTYVPSNVLSAFNSLEFVKRKIVSLANNN